ncbi:hypothetical protein [Nostoc sp. NMS8]|uniref:hypothetical protein n=1 Tax=Nostoc sp. NMS8 TaxID=2815392 RepID=UPI0025ED7BD0|nr:hypothetical protein [Nostoc sp. NMS8]MBN3959673.1 hypothetical protein [Nostoc sp. NMS8]
MAKKLALLFGVLAFASSCTATPIHQLKFSDRQRLQRTVLGMDNHPNQPTCSL